MKTEERIMNELEDDNIGTWMITYSDMITILMCLFVIFFIISARENVDLTIVKEDLKTKVSALETEKQVLEKKNNELMQKLFELDNTSLNIEDSNEDFVKFLKENKLIDSVTLVSSKEGVMIRFNDSVMFESGKSEVTAVGKEVLKQIGEKIKAIDNEVVIEGYTDNIPIKTSRYPSNWELSAARAISVVKYFIDDLHIEEERLSFTGWGERKPIAENDTDDGRNKNRRIEITILN